MPARLIAKIPQSLRQHPAARPQPIEPLRRSEVVLRRRRFEECNRPRACQRQLRRDAVEERALSGENGAALRDKVGRLEKDLRRAGPHDAGKRPSRDRHRPLEGTGRKQDPLRHQCLGAAVAFEVERAVGIDMPQRRVRAVFGTAAAQRRGQIAAGDVIGPERRVRRRALDRAVDLSARRGLLVDQHGLDPELGGQRRSRHAGGTRPDNRQGCGHPLPNSI